MDAVERTHHDVTMLYNITNALYTNLNYQQIVPHIFSILANHRDSIYYMRQVAMHAMDYKDAATTGILSLHTLPVEDLRKMLIHIKEKLPSTMDLLVSSEDTLDFYRYLHTHVLITDKEFLLLIDVSIQDHTQQLEIYKVFNLVIPHRNFSAHYNINSKYLGITYDETKQWRFQNNSSVHVKGLMDSFAVLTPPLQPLANTPSCITVIYTKSKAGIQKRCSLQIRKAKSATIPTLIALNVLILMSVPAAVSAGIMIICPEEAPGSIKTQTPIHILHQPSACSATLQHFHLPPCYETHELTINNNNYLKH